MLLFLASASRRAGAVEFFQAGAGALLLFLTTFGLESLEFGDICLQLIAEAALLQRDVVEIFAIGEEDVTLQGGFTLDGVGFVFDEVSAIFAGDGQNAGFPRHDAEEAPFGVGDELNERFFLGIDGREFGEVTVEVSLVDGGVVGGKENDAAAHRGADGVERYLRFTGGAGRPGTFEGIGSVSGELLGGDAAGCSGWNFGCGGGSCVRGRELLRWLWQRS